MKRKMFVCFTGIDGSGKTTLSKIVYNHYKKKYSKVRHTYGRFVPLLTFLIMKLGRTIFLKENNFVDYEKQLIEKKRLFRKHSFLAKFYISMVVFEYFFEILFKIIIPKKLGYSIIADRYVYDTVINDIAIDFDLTSDGVKSITNQFFAVIPKPDVTFVIDTPVETAYNRKKDIPSQSYLKIRNEFYQKLVSDEITKIDGTKEPASLMDEVISRIEKLKD